MSWSLRIRFHLGAVEIQVLRLQPKQSISRLTYLAVRAAVRNPLTGRADKHGRLPTNITDIIDSLCRLSSLLWKLLLLLLLLLRLLVSFESLMDRRLVGLDRVSLNLIWPLLSTGSHVSRLDCKARKSSTVTA